MLLTSTWARAHVEPRPGYEGHVEDLAMDRPEAWALNWFTSVGVPTGTNIPRPIRAGSVWLSLEAGWVPSLSLHQRMVGFNGTKEEALNQVPVFSRLNLLVGLPWR